MTSARTIGTASACERPPRGERRDRLRPAVVGLATVLFVFETTAHAEPPDGDTPAMAATALSTSSAETTPHETPQAPRTTPPTTPAPASTDSPLAHGGWGWIVVVSSVVVGAALTTYGLTIDCDANDQSCRRWASLPIWSGIGIAGLGTALGITVVELGRDARVQVAPAAATGAGSRGGTSWIRIEGRF